MSRNSDRQRLLADVLQDDDSFRASLLSQTIGRAQRRRRRRVAARVMLPALALFLVLFWDRKVPPAGRYPALVVESASNGAFQPLNIVNTGPGSLSVVSSSAGGFETFETPAARVETISDERLLALLAPRPAALVRRTPGETELILVDSDTASAPQ